MAVKRVIIAPIKGRRDHLSQSLKLALIFGPLFHVAIGLYVHRSTAYFGRFDHHRAGLCVAFADHHLGAAPRYRVRGRVAILSGYLRSLNYKLLLLAGLGGGRIDNELGGEVVVHAPLVFLFVGGGAASDDRGRVRVEAHGVHIWHDTALISQASRRIQ